MKLPNSVVMSAAHGHRVYPDLYTLVRAERSSTSLNVVSFFSTSSTSRFSASRFATSAALATFRGSQAVRSSSASSSQTSSCCSCSSSCAGSSC